MHSFKNYGSIFCMGGHYDIQSKLTSLPCESRSRDMGFPARQRAAMSLRRAGAAFHLASPIRSERSEGWFVFRKLSKMGMSLGVWTIFWMYSAPPAAKRSRIVTRGAIAPGICIFSRMKAIRGSTYEAFSDSGMTQVDCPFRIAWKQDSQKEEGGGIVRCCRQNIIQVRIKCSFL